MLFCTIIPTTNTATWSTYFSLTIKGPESIIFNYSELWLLREAEGRRITPFLQNFSLFYNFVVRKCSAKITNFGTEKSPILKGGHLGADDILRTRLGYEWTEFYIDIDIYMFFDESNSVLLIKEISQNQFIYHIRKNPTNIARGKQQQRKKGSIKGQMIFWAHITSSLRNLQPYVRK